jgi:uncharacterized PurR-regulated membrane protein YhhQ (DUF165 family)
MGFARERAHRMMSLGMASAVAAAMATRPAVADNPKKSDPENDPVASRQVRRAQARAAMKRGKKR